MPDTAELVRRIEAWRTAGELAQARAFCAELVARAPEDADAWRLAAVIAMDQRRWTDAVAAFETSLKLKVDAMALMRLAICYAKLNRLGDAHYCADGAVQVAPAWIDPRIEYATILHGMRRFRDALDQLVIAEAIDAGDDRIYLRRGCTLVELGRYEEAQQAFATSAQTAKLMVFSKLMAFDEETFRRVDSDRARLPAPVPAFRSGDAHATRVVTIACDARYARKYGPAFIRSYAQQKLQGALVHVHIVDPDDHSVAEIRAAAAAAGVPNLAVTTERCPLTVDTPREKKSYYACSRLLHLPRWIAEYGVPILVLDADLVVEKPLEAIFEAAAGSDAGLNPRAPINAPWLDIVANVIVANPTAAARRYFEAVASFALSHLRREPTIWLIDQSSLFCVLRMFERFDAPPKVAWLAEAEETVWHIGGAYDHLLEDPRFRRFAGPV